MGLPMNNIHSPTVVVPSGPSTDHSAANGAPQEKMPLMDLIAEKTRVEEELKALGSVLDSVRSTAKYCDTMPSAHDQKYRKLKRAPFE